MAAIMNKLRVGVILLLRPSQDSSLSYGYALNFNSITKLSIYEYEEELLE
jgi:hypothetical protein